MIERLSAQSFRCLNDVNIEVPPEGGTFVGGNGAGKTSLLESIYFLIRGRSFRQSRAERLIQHDGAGFQLTGRLRWSGKSHQVGVAVNRGETPTIRVDAKSVKTLSLVGTEVAVQVLEPEIHRLISEGPDARRGYLDYGVFHVEPGYLSAWRRFRTALKQRNAALKGAVSDSQLDAWDQEILDSAETVDGYRQGYVNLLEAPLKELVSSLSLPEVELRYQPGWRGELSLAEALINARNNDRERQTTSVGPHRADLAVRWSGRLARPSVSRGQQKLLASALVLAQTKLVAGLKQDETILLLDDPGAELDRRSLSLLMDVIGGLPGQHIVATLDLSSIPEAQRGAVFHVEQGRVTSG